MKKRAAINKEIKVCISQTEIHLLTWVFIPALRFMLCLSNQTCGQIVFRNPLVVLSPYSKYITVLLLFFLTACQTTTQKSEKTASLTQAPLCIGLAATGGLDKLPPPVLRNNTGNSHLCRSRFGRDNNHFNEAAWKAALDLEAAIAYDEPPRLMYPIGESLGRLHLKRGEPPEARKAFALALTQRPQSPFIQTLMSKQTSKL